MPRPLDNFTPNQAALGCSRQPLLTLDLSVITPLFGGGAVAREVDRERPVSAKTIRGHLRFWWRACRGADYATAHELFEAEAQIWGSTENPAAVQVSVEIITPGRPVQWAEFEMWNGRYRRLPTPKPEYPSYALFPFQGKATSDQIVEQPATALEGVRFRLRLNVPPAAGDAEEFRGDVEAAGHCQSFSEQPSFITGR